nr:alpha/beta hydrolase [Gordonia sp. 'Campus']
MTSADGLARGQVNPSGGSPDTVDIDLGHLTLRALTWGPDDGPVAVCLHGFPDSAWTWRHLGPELAKAGYRVIAPFTRGYAPSDIPADKDFHVAALAHDARGIHAAVGAGDDAVLIGHDWGAMTANALAHRDDNPYAAVVSMAVPPVPAVRRSLAQGAEGARMLGRQLLMSWYIAFNQLPWGPERTLDTLIPLLWRRWRLTRRSRPAQLDIDHALAALPTPAHRSAALGYYRALRTPRVDPRYSDLRNDWLGEPRCRTLYLHGADDGCMQSRFTDRVREVLPPGSGAAVIAGAGHFLHLDEPDEVNARILGFLSETRGGDGVARDGSAS